MRANSIVIIAEELPSFQKAGNNVWLGGIVDLLTANGIETTLYLTSGRLGFLLRRKDAFAFRIASPSIKEVGPYYLVWHPSAAAFSLLWEAFLRLPRPLQVIITWMRGLLRARKGYEYRLGTFPSQETIHSVQRFLLETRPSAIIFNTVFVYFPTDLPTNRQFLLVHDVVHERVASLKAQGYRTFPESFGKSDELKIMEKVGGAICVQWDEAQRLQSLVPNTKFIVVPPAMQLRDSATAAEPCTCIFVGSGSLPNVDGLNWFLDKIWPSVRTRVPNARLKIYGSICSRMAKVPDGVELYGVVEQISSAYERAQIAVIPLRVGSGLKIKIVEALMHAMPTVTTSAGAEGLIHLEPRPFIIADEPSQMADSISDLLISVEKRCEFQTKAQAVKALFEPAQVYDQLARALGLSSAKKS